MGQVRVTAKVENLMDALAAHLGNMPADQVRSVEVTDALVDTGAMFLGMPKQMITQLGLVPMRTRQARTAAGIVTMQVYDAVRLIVENRPVTCEVMELPDGCPVLIGQIPLEALDFIVDMPNRRLIGNPDHGGQFMMDAF